jgi:hypothetical protein
LYITITDFSPNDFSSLNTLVRDLNAPANDPDRFIDVNEICFADMQNNASGEMITSVSNSPEQSTGGKLDSPHHGLMSPNATHRFKDTLNVGSPSNRTRSRYKEMEQSFLSQSAIPNHIDTALIGNNSTRTVNATRTVTENFTSDVVNTALAMAQESPETPFQNSLACRNTSNFTASSSTKSLAINLFTESETTDVGPTAVPMAHQSTDPAEQTRPLDNEEISLRPIHDGNAALPFMPYGTHTHEQNQGAPLRNPVFPHSKTAIRNMSVENLRSHMTEYNLNTEGNKVTLYARMTEYMDQNNYMPATQNNRRRNATQPMASQSQTSDVRDAEQGTRGVTNPINATHQAVNPDDGISGLLLPLMEKWFMAPRKTTPEMKTGKANESNVIQMLPAFMEKRSTFRIQHIEQYGLLSNRQYPELCVSPDGIKVLEIMAGNGDLALLEIKTKVSKVETQKEYELQRNRGHVVVTEWGPSPEEFKEGVQRTHS